MIGIIDSALKLLLLLALIKLDHSVYLRNFLKPNSTTGTIIVAVS
jgi:hypothetical protein